MHGHAPAHHDEPAGERRPWTILVLLAVAQFMVVLDVTVVNVALPSIGGRPGLRGRRPRLGRHGLRASSPAA